MPSQKVLTDRQEDYVQRIADGWTASEIAPEFGAKPASVKATLGRARLRLGVPACADTVLVAAACMFDAIWISAPSAQRVDVPERLRYLLDPVSAGVQALEIAGDRSVPYLAVVADHQQLRRLMQARTQAHLVARLWQDELAPTASRRARRTPGGSA
ncbi:hypothetical protein ACIRPN_18350 [Streptomyces sp. NPDC101230]|uniref:hypothetical protein n=1 Tax=unclassified Streptomyces TaxID=2593676 RepID=UPI003805FAC2